MYPPTCLFPASHFILLLASPYPPNATPLPPVFLSWGENMVCTSGGDPDSPVGKGCQVKDTLHCVCMYLCVRVCPEGVMWSGPQMLLITNSWRDPASTNRTSCWPWHQEEGGALMLGLFIYYALLILKMWVSKMFWQNLNSAWRRASILAPAQCRAVQLSQMSLLSWAFKGILCAHVKVLWFCEEQKTPLKPECRLECMPPHPPAGLSPKF